MRAPKKPIRKLQPGFSDNGACGWGRRVRMGLLAGALLAVATVTAEGAAEPHSAPGAGRIRYIIETDAGGDPDDEQSFVRFLLYANEWDVEGIIGNRAVARAGENLNRERTGLGILRKMVGAYGQCYERLVANNARYPKPERLLELTVPGYADTEAGVDLIMATVDREDERPVWFSNWGTDHGSAGSCLKRALDKVLKERGPGGYAAFKQKIRLVSADAFGEHTVKLMPAFPLWVDTFRPEMDGKRWYHRFSAITGRVPGFDIERDIRTGHGPLGALYPTNTTHWLKEGDTMSFLYLVPTGLSDPEQPGWGSWAGRYGHQEESPGKPYFWANQQDCWDGTTNRDNTLKRWAAELQNDFKARMDWCVLPPGKANHPPVIEVNGHSGAEAMRLETRAAARIELDASRSSDPDGNELRFRWNVYREAGTYRGDVPIEQPSTSQASLRVPADAAGQSIHVVLSVTDVGDPPLTRYKRVQVRVAQPDWAISRLRPLFEPPAEFKEPGNAYKSQLVFGNAGGVRTAADWARRRQEIAREWERMLGPWPQLIGNPKMQILSRAQRENFVQSRVRLEIAPGQEGDGWLLVPGGSGRKPAVLVVYYEPETSVGLGQEALRDFAYQLTKRGFVTLSIGTPGGNAWRPDTKDAPCQPLSYHAYVAANCWQALANLREVDPGRIGVVGHSYGGKWSMFAGALWEKFTAVAVSDPGIVFDETRANVNYWEPWYLGMDAVEKRPKAGIPSAENPRTGAYKRLVEGGHDLHELHALIAPRPFFVSGGSEDPPSRWEALNRLVEINRLLGFTNRVAMGNRPGHGPTEESNEQLYAFFEHFLNGGGPGR